MMVMRKRLLCECFGMILEMNIKPKIQKLYEYMKAEYPVVSKIEGQHKVTKWYNIQDK